jgi:hypothetical protein
METWSEILRNRKFWAAIFASRVLKEILTRLSVLTTTGALRLWSRALNVASLGSAAVRDAPYSSAALNPYPVPPVMLLSIAALVFISLNVFLLGKVYLRLIVRYLRKNQKATNILDRFERTSENQAIDKRRMLITLFVSSYIVAFCIAVFIPVGIENEAVLARRLYEADRDIAAPYLTASELTQLQSDFVQIETKAQYKTIMNRLAAIGDEHHLNMRKVTW